MKEDGKTVTCRRCSYKWFYRGKLYFYARCPQCLFYNKIKEIPKLKKR